MRLWPDERILSKIRRLLKTKGRLSERLILRARGMPSTNTIHYHFGTYRQLYEKVGYRLDAQYVFTSEQGRRSTRFRRELIEELRVLFPEHIAVTQLGIRTRSMLLVDNTFLVSVLLCRTGSKKGVPRYWEVYPPPAERDYIALVCTMNQKHDGALDYYLFPKMDMWKSHRLRRNDPLEGSTVKLNRLADFYATVLRLRKERVEDSKLKFVFAPADLSERETS